MTLAQSLQAANATITIDPKTNAITVNAPAGSITPGLISKLRNAKPALLAAINPPTGLAMTLPHGHGLPLPTDLDTLTPYAVYRFPLPGNQIGLAQQHSDGTITWRTWPHGDRFTATRAEFKQLSRAQKDAPPEPPTAGKPASPAKRASSPHSKPSKAATAILQPPVSP